MRTQKIKAVLFMLANKRRQKKEDNLRESHKKGGDEFC